jgi:preprotein translocase subunit SecE
MAKSPGARPTAQKTKTPPAKAAAAASTSVAAPAGAADAAPKKPFNPVQFFTEVRAEARKVTWTSWKETWITSVMVAIMVVMTAVFFSALDAALGLVMHGVLKLAGAG